MNATKNQEHCLNLVSDWMTANRLKLNSNKVECIQFGTKVQLSKMLSQCRGITKESDTTRASRCVLDSSVMLHSYILLAEISSDLLNKIQGVQDAAATFMFRLKII